MRNRRKEERREIGGCGRKEGRRLRKKGWIWSGLEGRKEERESWDMEGGREREKLWKKEGKGREGWSEKERGRKGERRDG